MNMGDLLEQAIRGYYPDNSVQYEDYWLDLPHEFCLVVLYAK